MDDEKGRRITHQKLGDMVATRIKDYIIEHGLTEGDRLPTEQQLAEMFGVSRLSVRETTKALAFLGIISAAPRRGLTLGRVDMRRVSEYLGFHFALNGYPRGQLVKARKVIELGALPEAMEHIASDDATYQRLRAMNERLRNTDDAATFIAGDLAFHQALIACSQIGPLEAFSGVLEIFFSRFKEDLAKVRSGWTRGIESHQEILGALRVRDLVKATELLTLHFARYKD